MKRDIDVLWNTTLIGWIKGNTDDVAMGTHSLCACVPMFRYINGDHVGSFSYFIEDGNALIVEFIGAIMAMEVAIDKNLDNIWTETNSFIVARALYNTNLVPWSIKSRWLNCLHRMRNFGLRITHIYREGNICVDILASLGLKNKNAT